MSSFRIRSFLGKDRIKLDQPRVVSKTLDEDDAIDYFWYLISAPKGEFDYQISVGSTSGDPDLYVAVFDGRRPNEDDWDYRSKMYGADTIRIASTDDFFSHQDLNLTRGVIVSIGVKFKSEKGGNYTLSMTSNLKTKNIKRISQNEPQHVKLPPTPSGNVE